MGILSDEEAEQHKYNFKMFKQITGKEVVVEYHLFNMVGSDMQFVQRWRLNK